METIVVVDDDRVFRELLKTVLKMEGYRAVESTVPEEVLPTVRAEAPALVLMDVHIRNQDTLSTLSELKSDADVGGIPVIMTSGMDRADECLSAGADAFILKPFRPSQMLAQITELIQAQKQDS